MATTVSELKNKGLAALQAKLVRQYGDTAAVFGGIQKDLAAIPTGSLALDEALGTGGWPVGSINTVFGPRDIGKSSIVGFAAVRNAQAMGLNCAWVAVEPVGDAQWRAWARANGVDVEKLLVTYPGLDSPAEDALSMLIECAKTPDCGLVVFDSVGGLLSATEVDDDGKMKVGGQAGLVTWAVKAVAPAAYHNDVCVLMLNQVRDDMKSRIPGMVKMPGGNALEHHSTIIVQLRKGKDRYTIKGAEDAKIEVGYSVVATVKRNKKTEGTGQKAIFDYYNMKTEDHEIGIDSFTDIINTAKRVGVIKQSTNADGKAGSMYELPNGHKVKGFDNVVEYLEKQPGVVNIIRDEVLLKMLSKQGDNGQERD